MIGHEDLWAAIRAYVGACGGDIGADGRKAHRAIVAIERAIADEIRADRERTALVLDSLALRLRSGS